MVNCYWIERLLLHRIFCILEYCALFGNHISCFNLVKCVSLHGSLHLTFVCAFFSLYVSLPSVQIYSGSYNQFFTDSLFSQMYPMWCVQAYSLTACIKQCSWRGTDSNCEKKKKKGHKSLLAKQLLSLLSGKKKSSLLAFLFEPARALSPAVVDLSLEGMPRKPMLAVIIIC